MAESTRSEPMTPSPHITRTRTRTRFGRPRASALLRVFVAMFGPVGVAGMVDVAEAKSPGRSHCFLGRCHRVLTLAETRSRLGRTEILRASFYDDCARDRFNPCALTSSGEAFRPSAPDNAASPVYPDGTMLLLFYPATGAAAVVRVNNAGPYHSTRLIDVSVATAAALGFREQGLADLQVRVIAAPRPDEATYRRLRRYWPVHGPIGRHGSIAEAHVALVDVSDLPRVPARPDAGQLVSLPMSTLTTTSAAAVPMIAVADPPALTASLPPPPAAIALTRASRDEQPLIAQAPRAVVVVSSASTAGTVVPATTSDGMEIVSAREPADAADDLGLLASLRAKARHRLTPGRLPDLGMETTVAWLREAAMNFAAQARSAARIRIKPSVTAKLASLGSPGGSPGGGPEASRDQFSRR